MRESGSLGAMLQKDSKNEVPESVLALAENHAKPYSMEECAHQFIRSFLHMHDEQLHAVIAHM
jgi:hypothetical protein